MIKLIVQILIKSGLIQNLVEVQDLIEDLDIKKEHLKVISWSQIQLFFP